MLLTNSAYAKFVLLNSHVPKAFGTWTNQPNKYRI